jgi:site-specific DNA-methyltransferase (adenine-specific)
MSIKHGQIELNKIYNQDCYELLKNIKTGAIDLLLQDTPFGCTRNDWDIKPDLLKMWHEWERVTKENGAMIFFATQPFASELILSNVKNFRYDLIWYKALGTGFLNANKMPMRNHELILVFYRKLPTYNPQMVVGKMRMKGSKKGNATTNYGSYEGKTKVDDQYYPQSVIDFSNGDRTSENDHPTQKPLDLIRYLIKTFSNESDLVFDGYMGSGTTAIAAIKENRKYLGAELSKKYYETANKRIKTELLQTKLF